MTALLISSVLLSVAYCAPPGAVTVETIRRGAARGFGPALLVQVGSLIGDMTWALIAVSGAAFLIQNTIARSLLSLLGIGLLLRLAWAALKEACSGMLSVTASISEASPFVRRGDLAIGALLSLSNPFAIAFWTGVSGSVFAAVSGSPQWYHFATFFAAFLAVALLWCFFLAGLVAWGRRFITFAFFRWVNLTCGLSLGCFAIYMLWNVLKGL